MKNIWKIFQRDMMRIRKNVIALVVIVGISVVPCLYAWFNIAASWDPYSNTGNLKVAVASVDEGYEGSLIPLEINIGDQVLSALRENTQMEWVFTTKDKAAAGVKSGKYYAAIVIPKDFSNKMMSVFSENVEKPEITYYSNAKENAIAPKVTDKGASAVQRQVNQVFIETISDTTLTVLQAVSNMTEASGAETIVSNLNTNLNRISGDLSASAGLLQSFSDMTVSAQNLLNSTTEFMQSAQTQSQESKQTFQKSKDSFSDIDSALDAATDNVETALNATQSVYDEMNQTITKAFETQRRLNFQMGIPRDVKIEGLSNFVFMSRSGRPMMPTTVNFILRDIVKAYNEEENERAMRERRKPEELPHISAHILRHTACTRMAETDLDMKVVQYVMGHANISVTMEVYNHITDRSRIEKEIAKMDLVQIM